MKKKITSDDLKVNLQKLGKSTEKQPTARTTSPSCNCDTGGATLDHCKTRIPCDTEATCDTCETCYACGPTLNPSLDAGTLCQTDANCTSNNCNLTEQTDCVATISAGAVCCEFTRANGCQDTVDNCPQKPSVDVCPATQQATCENYTCVPVETRVNCLASDLCISINDPCKPIESVNICKPIESVNICISPNKANQ